MEQHIQELGGVITRTKIKNGCTCKQDFKLLYDENNKYWILTKKLILENENALVKSYLDCGFKLVKEYKGKKLFEQYFTIRINTLLPALNDLMKILKDN